MQTTFPRKFLLAASNLMAKSDLRYYLVGVLVESLPGETRLAATDGAVAGVFRSPRANEDRFEVIIPAAIIAIVVKLKSEVLGLECVDGRWSVGGMAFVPVDGKFPDYRRIIQTPPAVPAAGNYAVELLARFAKTGKDLGIRSNPIVRQNGEHSALVHFYAFDDFVGVLMPLRMFTEKMPDLGFPNWGALRV